MAKVLQLCELIKFYLIKLIGEKPAQTVSQVRPPNPNGHAQRNEPGVSLQVLPDTQGRNSSHSLIFSVQRLPR